MTGNQLKKEIKKLEDTQELVAEKLGITRRTLQNWFALDELDANILQNLKDKLGLDFADGSKVNSTYAGATLIPLLPIFAQGGKLNDFLTSVSKSDCEQVVSPIRDVDFAITITGDSMAPEYPNGSQLLIKKIDEKLFIDWGKVYVLDTPNGTLVKVVTESGRKGYVTCSSINPDRRRYAPFEVPLKEVFGLYRVVLCMSVK